MKKLICLLVLIILILSFAGCAKEAKYDADGTYWAGHIEDDTMFMGALNRNKMVISSVMHLPIYKFEKKAALDAFIKGYAEKEDMALEYDGNMSFIEATNNLNDRFFEENTLIIVYVPATSGSLRFGIKEIYLKDEHLCIYVEQTNSPEVHTDDMAGWFITAAFSKKDIEKCKYFDAQMG